jgi:hypothetical protein
MYIYDKITYKANKNIVNAFSSKMNILLAEYEMYCEEGDLDNMSDVMHKIRDLVNDTHNAMNDM